MIRFQSDENENLRGFQAMYTAVGGRAANCPSPNAPLTLTVNSDSTSASEELDFMSDGDYLNNAHCSWILQVDSGISGALEIFFTDFSTEE
eukprot:3367082-Rhodomonas_salina.1